MPAKKQVLRFLKCHLQDEGHERRFSQLAARYGWAGTPPRNVPLKVLHWILAEDGRAAEALSF